MAQQTVEGGIAIPEGLKKLPVAKQLNTIDFSKKAFIARAATGSGKTLLVPTFEAMLRKAQGKTGCIAMRIPTKVAGTFVTSGIRKFWEPLGLKVAILNRDVTPAEEKKCATADLVIISDGSLNRLRKLTEVATYYCDEAHWLFLNAEIDLAIARMLGMDIRLLSATVDERPFIEYLGDGTGNYVLEGRSFPINKHTVWMSADIFKRDSPAELYTYIEQVAKELNEKNESALFFLPTRAMAEAAAEKFQKVIPTTFVHGDVSPVEAEAWVNRHEGKPFIVFATKAAATGITLNIHRSYVADEIIDSVVERGMERMQSGKMDDNMILQAAGRAGRIREGDAYLITHEDYRDPNGVDPWLTIQPRPVQPPAEKATPFEVILAMAQHGITNDSGLNMLSKLDPGELGHAREWLVRHGCLNVDGTLTKMGQYVANFPLSAQYAHLVLSAPSIKSRLTILAALSVGLQGTYGMVKIKPRSLQLQERRFKDPEWPMFPRACIVHGSVPMSLAKLVKELVRLEDSKNIYAWADKNNLWAKAMFVARKDFIENSKFILDDGAKRAFLATDLDDPNLQHEVHEHLKRHPLYKPMELRGSAAERMRPIGRFDAIFADAFRLETNVRDWQAWAIPKLIVKPKFKMFGLEMGFIEVPPSIEEVPSLEEMNEAFGNPLQLP